MLFDFSNHARAHVPTMKKMGTTGELIFRIHWIRDMEHGAQPQARARGQDDGSSKQTPSNNMFFKHAFH